MGKIMFTQKLLLLEEWLVRAISTAEKEGE